MAVLKNGAIPIIGIAPHGAFLIVVFLKPILIHFCILTEAQQLFQVSSQEIKVQRSSYMTQIIKNHDWKLYNAFSSSISQVNLNIVFKLVLSSSSPTNLKIMAHHAKWSKKGNFEKKNNSTLQNRHYWREKHLKY